MPSVSPRRAVAGGHCLPNAIAPTSVCLRGRVTADRPGVLIPAFTHHLAARGRPSAGLLSVALGLGRRLRPGRPTLLFRWVSVPAPRSGGCREVPLARRRASGIWSRSVAGAHDRDRTGDLVLTKNVLYLLSYVGAVVGTGFEPV